MSPFWFSCQFVLANLLIYSKMSLLLTKSIKNNIIFNEKSKK
ncbi:hypothetical protein B4113_2879 [Geobacillus sp. B4113_201601]|nr:hypothetical protein B4113_2879 [Geobacillus sp. B4113_201601]